MKFLFKNNLSNKINNKINNLLYLKEEADRVNLGRVTFQDWMTSRLGPDYRVPGPPSLNLYLYRQFFIHNPNGKPPNSWATQTYVTPSQINRQLERVGINPYSGLNNNPESDQYQRPLPLKPIATGGPLETIGDFEMWTLEQALESGASMAEILSQQSQRIRDHMNNQNNNSDNSYSEIPQ